MKDILVFFDTDKNPSPFDILMAYDAGFDVVVPYGNMEAEMARGLVQDAIFPRGPEGVKRTCFFIGGSDVREAGRILETTKESMVPPFEASIIVDPRGANTTGSAMMAKVENGLSSLGESMEGKKVTVLAGTGPVGRLVSGLSARLGSEVSLTSRKRKRAERIAEGVSEEFEVEVEGLQASNPEEITEAIKEADVVFSVGKTGVRMVSEETLDALPSKRRVFSDGNAVPPLGIEGLDPNDDMKEFRVNTYGIGALASGRLKSEVEARLLTEARKADKGIFDHQRAFKLAREILKK